jgi:hypothetical protein
MTDGILTSIFAALLIAGLLFGYSALMTAIKLLRTERVLGRLFWFVTSPRDAGSSRTPPHAKREDGRET